MKASFRPPFLKAGDKVAVVSPSGIVEREALLNGVDVIAGWGLKPVLGRSALKRSGIFAGTDEERLYDLQEAIDDKDVKAIFCSRGGYGLTRIISRVDGRELTRRAKWITGFSDITAIHLWLNGHLQIATVHGEMPVNYLADGVVNPSGEMVRRALFGEDISLSWSGGVIRPAVVRGEITGGNLSLLAALAGTPFAVNAKDKILFIEETGEYLYRLDRMIQTLKLAGVFSQIKGLLVGGMNDMSEGRTEWGISPEQLIADSMKEYEFPVFFGFPAGHMATNNPLYFGVEASLKPGDGDSSLLFNL